MSPGTPLAEAAAVPAAVPRAGPGESLLWLLGRRRRFKVEGGSMEPTLADGDEVLVDPRAYRRRSPVAGEVVVALHPFVRGLRLVKRVARVEAGGAVALEGDNPGASTDGRTLGTVPPEGILGRVTARWEGTAR